MARIISRLASGWVVRFPRSVVLVFAVLSIASIWVTVDRLEFKTDQNDLVSADLEYNRRYLRFLEEFGDLEFIYVVIEVEGDPDRARAVADAVAGELEKLTRPGPQGREPFVEWYFHRIPPEELKRGLLQLEDADALEARLSLLGAAGEHLPAMAGAGSFEDLIGAFDELLRPELLQKLGAAGGGGGEEIGELGFRILEFVLDSLRSGLGGEVLADWDRELANALDLSPRDQGYLMTENGRLMLVEILPAKDLESTELIREPLIAIRQALRTVRDRFPGVELGLTGRPVLQADEMRTTEKDMKLATIVALAGVLLLFVIFFRRLRRPALGVLALSVSIALTFGLVTVTIGYLTLLSIVFAAMLVGLGIDFGIHFVARYQEELARGLSVDDAIRQTLATAGGSISTAAVTTAAAFFTILFVDFKGLRELGWIAGAGVLLCLTSMLILLPALLCITDRRSLAKGRFHDPQPVSVPGLHLLSVHPRTVIVTLSLLTAAGLFFFRGFSYNANLLDLQARGLESVKYELLLIDESDFSTWYCAFIADSQEEVRDIIRRLEPAREAGVVGVVESVESYLGDVERKRRLLEKVWAQIGEIEIASPSRAVDRGGLRERLEGLLDRLDDLASFAIAREKAEEARELSRVSAEVEDLIDSLEDLAAENLARTQDYQEEWFRRWTGLLEDIREGLRPRALTPSDLPAVLRRRLVSADGSRFVVMACPAKDIWAEENMKEFIDAVTKVDPGVTGTPIQVYESSWRMQRGFQLAALYALAVTFALVLIDLRHLRDALLAMIPLVFGLLWLLELLPLVGLDFNLANFFALPILIGCGIDGGVHIVHRFRETGDVGAVVRTTCSAVTLSFLTTIVGFGAMSFAHHRGVASLGLMMTAGLLCLIVASVVVLPAVLKVLPRR
ncbi:MAG: MMPL family transporter [Planctomycetes bacterium]|nr:MMPL family transporter [Planctomycetota bacterium]